MRHVILFTLMLTLSACAPLPPLAMPAAPVPATFADPGLAAPEASAAVLTRAQLFQDQRLLRIIDLALENNRDLRMALMNVAAARAQNRVQTAEARPGIDAQASYSRERTAALDGRESATTDQHALSIGLNAFELDLFGRVRSLSDAAFARYLASQEGYRAARLTLIGAVADAYFAERRATEQQALSQQTLADWRRSLDLARVLQQSGRDGAVDLVRAEAQVALAEADLQARERAIAQAANALRLLVGVDLPADLPPPLALAGNPVLMHLPAGLPSDLLLNRPDIRQAERTLAAAHADLGAARTAFFPRLSLTAAFGLTSPSLTGLFSAGHQGWNYTPRLVLPIFDGGRLDAELDLATARKNEAVAQYEKAIQTAFREVADGLAGRATLAAQIEAQNHAVSQSAHAVSLAEARYRAGLDSRLELLDAQRTLQAAQQALLTLRHEQIANAVALYKALGGGDADEIRNEPQL